MRTIYINLRVADVRRSARFYREGLGFAVDAAMTDASGEPVWATLRRGPARIMVETAASFGGAPVDPLAPIGGGVRCYIQLGADDDLDACFRLAVEHGATVVSEPADQCYGDRSFAVLDPDGYQLSLSQPIGRSDFGSLVVLSGDEADRVIG